MLALDGYGGSQESLFLKSVAIGRLLRAPVDGPTLGYTHTHFKNMNLGRAVVAHAFNPSTREAEAGGSL